MKEDVLQLPPELAEEVLCQYADVLRVGCVTLNGERIAWDTSASNDAQLRGFCTSFVTGLRKLPELEGVDRADICQAAHWFCKSVSINYALAELLAMLQQRIGERLGALCSVRTCGPDGKVLVDYSVQITAERRMVVRVTWRGKGNIICCKPKTAKKTVSGTLSYVETEFPIPLDQDFKPSYSISMALKAQGSKPSQLMSKVVQTFGRGKPGQLEEVSPTAPLRSSSSLGSAGTPSTASAVSTLSSRMQATGSDESDAEDCGLEEDLLFTMLPQSFSVRTVRTKDSRLGGATPLPRGLIRL
mmetsp:Transcript_49579/g.144119  ORF Transcript_49579/g.144119 Transcript_49579/m.144119 type:complete len:301 (+) Transcript_49579:48-950(+)